MEILIVFIKGDVLIAVIIDVIVAVVEWRAQRTYRRRQPGHAVSLEAVVDAVTGRHAV